MIPLYINKLMFEANSGANNQERYEFSDPSTPLLDTKDFLDIGYERSDIAFNEKELASLITKEDLHRGIRFDVAPGLPHHQKRWRGEIYCTTIRRPLNSAEIKAVLKVLKGV